MLFINVLFTVTHHHLCVCKCGVYAQCTCAHLCVWVWNQHWVFSSVALRLVFGTRSLTDSGSDVAGQRALRSLLVPYPSTGSVHSVTLAFYMDAGNATQVSCLWSNSFVSWTTSPDSIKHPVWLYIWLDSLIPSICILRLCSIWFSFWLVSFLEQLSSEKMHRWFCFPFL